MNRHYQPNSIDAYSMSRVGSSYRLDFKLLEAAVSSISPGSGYRLEVSCILAAGQSTYALGLKPDRRAKLIGVFDEYDIGRSTIFLRVCHANARRSQLVAIAETTNEPPRPAWMERSTPFEHGLSPFLERAHALGRVAGTGGHELAHGFGVQRCRDIL